MDHPPRARARLPLVLFILAFLSLSVIFFGSDKARSGSIARITHKFDSGLTTLVMPLRRVDDLEEALAGAATRYKTVILTMVNKAYVEGEKAMLDIFLDGFWMGEGTRPLVNHLLIIAVDQTAYERCMFLRLHCYKMKTDGVDFVGEKMYMSEDFIKMMWQRTRILGDVLRRGYNFIFTDTDVLWLRDPFPRLNLNHKIDLQISVDEFNGNQWSEKGQMINTGFYMIKSNNKTITLFNEWYARRDNSTGMKEQDVLVELMKKGAFKRLGIGVRFLDTVFFSGICEDSRDVRAVVTVHANCCRSIKAKVHDLKRIMLDWQRFKASPIDETSEFAWSNHSACAESWKQ
ncbi:putative nucleotide-diphospho-sugar transferase [Helianthus annuus]|uniref:Nucleotide-diphospho-sugar transferase n=1 Tax=Helianthus annuus TaxID=4232 RepID=A0A251T8S2_HELAN|nr:uncharacterized protein At1g28695 [Helianthus annuus]KAF5805610.1 putative nucleotide-diphospho-sugar transferase [Helianthus annuus]KAJ0570016.1 putative nucleotide-diphospho-sugar transferase [Helianthus annuus]KAJ0576717.1 putative nucleotide-diphospho-sugar transferase [Helianthus annuus]KAJ0584346.1 putative nucleotide-diphospho-sugar transferase [Helianthus annuus]KAJ0922502.1 putative nucleotide-diphospho-sugar transferase [Helianthus annuus]